MAGTKTITTASTGTTIKPDICAATKLHPYAVTQCSPFASQEKMGTNNTISVISYWENTRQNFRVVGKSILVTVTNNDTLLSAKVPADGAQTLTMKTDSILNQHTSRTRRKDSTYACRSSFSPRK
jgi:hypothetical protein